MSNKTKTKGNKHVCVVIPVHKESMTEGELISFKQCLNVLKNRDIFIVCPKKLNLKEYHDQGDNFKVIEIDSKWQSSLLNYNKMKVSRFFYELFKDYNYLLTYELDAYVFKDDLDYWINKGYDYIGAPWFEGYNIPVSDKLVAVGNSGFSLRNVQVVRYILKNHYYKSPLEYERGKKKKIIATFKYPIRWLKNKFCFENYTIQNFSEINEDGFFSLVVPKAHHKFIIAPIEDAYKFSFEMKPDVLYELNNNQLPMGCHAWEKYNFNFWKNYINEY